ncbi:MAG TPA: hypothetical protein VGC36_06345, partial [Rhizomicrobium sp.]
RQGQVKVSGAKWSRETAAPSWMIVLRVTRDLCVRQSGAFNPENRASCLEANAIESMRFVSNWYQMGHRDEKEIVRKSI